MTPRVISFGLAAVCAAIAIALAVAAGDANRLRKAEDAGGRGDYVAALNYARAVHHEPGRTRAYAVSAYASLGLGDPLDSLRWFRLAIRSAPDDWQLRRDKAAPLLLLGRFNAAHATLVAAKRMNPKFHIPAPPRK